MAVDQDELNEFIGRFVGDLGATITAGGIVVGHRLGLYRALASAPATPDELATCTGTTPRYVAEWLRAQAAGGYVEHDPATGMFSMTEEQAFALTDPDGPLYVPGGVRADTGHATRSRRSPTRSVPAPGSAGTNTTTTCRSAARCSSGPATWPTWCPAGSPRWTACDRRGRHLADRRAVRR